jgi:hypothetical protein
MRKEPQRQFWSGHKPYLIFFGTSLYCELCTINISLFLAGNEYLGVNKTQFTPYLRRLCLLSAGASLLCCRLLVVLPPPVVHRRIHLRLLLCLRLSSHLCLASRPSCLVGCCISQSLSRSRLLHLHPVPWPPPLPFITPPPFVVPLLFGWLSRCPVPQPPSCCNSAWCLGLYLLLHPHL